MTSSAWSFNMPAVSFFMPGIPLGGVVGGLGSLGGLCPRGNGPVGYRNVPSTTGSFQWTCGTGDSGL